MSVDRDPKAEARLPVAPIPTSAVAADAATIDHFSKRDPAELVARLAAIVDSSDDAIISKDLNGTIDTWNKGAERLFGYTADEVIGKSITVLIPPERLDEETEILSRLRRGERVDHYETIRQRKDGRLIEVSITVSPVKNGAGRVIGASKIARDITERSRIEAHQKLLAAELDHRAKNMLAIIQVLVRQTRAASIPAFVESLQGRISALARAHTMLSESRWTGADLGRLLQEELAPFERKDKSRIKLGGPPVSLSPQIAQSVAMALHELATNAAKYGALSVPSGALSIEWTVDNNNLSLAWTESGGPEVTAPDRKGMGTMVITQTVERQLDGTIDLDWRREGFSCRIAIPMA